VRRNSTITFVCQPGDLESPPVLVSHSADNCHYQFMWKSGNNLENSLDLNPPWCCLLIHVIIFVQVDESFSSSTSIVIQCMLRKNLNSIGKMNVYLFVSRWNRFELLIATFDCNTASLHQAMRSIVYRSLFVAWWFAAIGAFRSSLLFRLLDVVPSQVCFVVVRLLCFLIVGIQASGISIPLSLLMLHYDEQ